MTALKVGSSGPEVVDLQDKLRQHGFDAGPSDGTFGTGTLAAVESFQRSAGMTPDGVVGQQTASALGLAGPAPALASPIREITAEVVCKMFPSTPSANIERHLPAVLNAMLETELGSKPMILMALATIRAETECFLPISEGQSTFNTSEGGHPFDKYDSRTDLGNRGQPDGERYKGRGFVQLTGRVNYDIHGRAIRMGEELVDNPDLANDPEIAAKLLASFIKSREIRLQNALAAGDLTTARRLVNGGSNGLDRFTDAYQKGCLLIPDSLSA